MRAGSMKNHALSSSRRHGFAHPIQNHSLAADVLCLRATAMVIPWGWAMKGSPCSCLWPQILACQSRNRRVDLVLALVSADSDTIGGV